MCNFLFIHFKAKMLRIKRFKNYICILKDRQKPEPTIIKYFLRKYSDDYIYGYCLYVSFSSQPSNFTRQFNSIIIGPNSFVEYTRKRRNILEEILSVLE